MASKRFKFMNDACGSMLPNEVKALRTIPPTTETWLAAAGLGSFIGTYFKMDKPGADDQTFMEDMRDGLPQLKLEPEVANAIIEKAHNIVAAETGVPA